MHIIDCILFFMETKSIREMITEWVKRDGKHVAVSCLTGRRISISAVDKLTRGAYPQEPTGAMREVIEQELEKAGILPTLNKATG